MSKISDAATRGFTPVLSLRQLVKRVGTKDKSAVVTINGFGYLQDKKGEKTPVLYCAEGVAIWATNYDAVKFVNALLSIYENDVAAINNDFRYTGVKIQVGPLMKTSKDYDYWPITKIADVEFEPRTDLEDNSDEDDEDETPRIDDEAPLPF